LKKAAETALLTPRIEGKFMGAALERSEMRP
jgi:hypothetical protein